MPCRYDETPEEQAACKKAANARLVKPYKDKLDKVTRLLCLVMTAADNAKSSSDLNSVLLNNDELMDWWDEHRTADERRSINEAAELRAKAMKKLTPEEKKALGLTK